MSKRTKHPEIEEFADEDRNHPRPLDLLLRKYGYKIYARDGKKEPLWVREGRHYLQSEALKMIALDQAKPLTMEL